MFAPCNTRTGTLTLPVRKVLLIYQLLLLLLFDDDDDGGGERKKEPHYRTAFWYILIELGRTTVSQKKCTNFETV